MGAALDLAALDELIQKAEKLKNILQETPQLIQLKSIPQNSGPILASLPKDYPLQMEVLVSSKQAAKMLKVNENRIADYVNQGLLSYVITPPASDRKYLLSDINVFIRSLEKHNERRNE